MLYCLRSVEAALLQNEVCNIFQDDFAALADEDGASSGTRKDVVSEYQSFTDLNYSKAKVSCEPLISVMQCGRDGQGDIVYAGGMVFAITSRNTLSQPIAEVHATDLATTHSFFTSWQVPCSNRMMLGGSIREFGSASLHWVPHHKLRPTVPSLVHYDMFVSFCFVSGHIT
jgi:hypothetical protein